MATFSVSGFCFSLDSAQTSFPSLGAPNFTEVYILRASSVHSHLTLSTISSWLSRSLVSIVFSSPSSLSPSSELSRLYHHFFPFAKPMSHFCEKIVNLFYLDQKKNFWQLRVCGNGGFLSYIDRKCGLALLHEIVRLQLLHNYNFGCLSY